MLQMYKHFINKEGLSFIAALDIDYIESQHLPGHDMTAVVFRLVTRETVNSVSGILEITGISRFTPWSRS